MSLLKKINIYSELFESEKNYVADLILWCKDFKRALLQYEEFPIQKRLKMSEGIFVNIDKMLDLHRKILYEMAQMNEACRKEYIEKICNVYGLDYYEIMNRDTTPIKFMYSGNRNLYYDRDEILLKDEYKRERFDGRDVKEPMTKERLQMDDFHRKESLLQMKKTEDELGKQEEEWLVFFRNITEYLDSDNMRNETSAFENQSKDSFIQPEMEKNFYNKDFSGEFTNKMKGSGNECGECSLNIENLSISRNKQGDTSSIEKEDSSGISSKSNQNEPDLKNYRNVHEEILLARKKPPVYFLYCFNFVKNDPYQELIMQNNEELEIYSSLAYEKIYEKYSSLFNIYHYYSYALPRIEFLMAKETSQNKHFCDFIENFLINRGCCLGHRHFMYRPTQKLTRYPLLFESLRKACTENLEQVSYLVDFFRQETAKIDKQMQEATEQFEIYKLFLYTVYGSNVGRRIPLCMFSKHRRLIRKHTDILVRSDLHIEAKSFTILVLDHLILICDAIDSYYCFKYTVRDEPIPLAKYDLHENTCESDDDYVYMQSQLTFRLTEIDGLRTWYFYIESRAKYNDLVSSIKFAIENHRKNQDKRIVLRPAYNVRDGHLLKYVSIGDESYVGNAFCNETAMRVDKYYRAASVDRYLDVDVSYRAIFGDRGASVCVGERLSGRKFQDGPIAVPGVVDRGCKAWPSRDVKKVSRRYVSDRELMEHRLVDVDRKSEKAVDFRKNNNKKSNENVNTQSNENHNKSNENNNKKSNDNVNTQSNENNNKKSNENVNTRSGENNNKKSNVNVNTRSGDDNNSRDSLKDSTNVNTQSSDDNQKPNRYSRSRDNLSNNNKRNSVFNYDKKMISDSSIDRSNETCDSGKIIYYDENDINNCSDPKDQKMLLEVKYKKFTKKNHDCSDVYAKFKSESALFQETATYEGKSSRKALICPLNMLKAHKTRDRHNPYVISITDFDESKSINLIDEGVPFRLETIPDHYHEDPSQTADCPSLTTYFDNTGLLLYSNDDGIFLKIHEEIRHIHKKRVLRLLYIKLRNIIIYIEDHYLKIASISPATHRLTPTTINRNISYYWYSRTEKTDYIIAVLKSTSQATQLHIMKALTTNNLTTFDHYANLYLGTDVYNAYIYNRTLIICTKEILTFDLINYASATFLNKLDPGYSLVTFDFKEPEIIDFIRVNQNTFLIITPVIGFTVDSKGGFCDQTVFFVFYDVPLFCRFYKVYLVVISLKAVVVYSVESSEVLAWLPFGGLRFVDGVNGVLVHDDSVVYELFLP